MPISTEPTTPYRLAMHGIGKAFGEVPVLQGVDLCVGRGEIHALLGENGAGKSTLLNILGGVLHAEAGTVQLDGETVRLRSPIEATRQGVAFIHQELNLVNDLTIYENIYLGREISRLGLLDRRAMIDGARAILARLGCSLDPRTPVGRLEISQKQTVEIARALREQARVIIMDEPTASLTDQDVTELFALMRGLRAEGVSLIFVSHKLPEVLEICDSYTVLRNGQVAGAGAITDVTEDTIIRLMVGEKMVDADFYRPRAKGQVLLRALALDAPPAYMNLRFTVARGEIIGFTGLTGDGRQELVETLVGLRRPSRGTLEKDGRALHLTHPQQALAAGIGLVPRNRKENGIVKDLSVLANLTLAGLEQVMRLGAISGRRERDCFTRTQAQLGIRASHPGLPITSLSGGNQQKVVLARWLEAGVDLLVMDNPTQGIDIGAKADIYRLIMAYAGAGNAVILLSPDVPELLKVCDRIYTMFHGRITGVFPRGAAEESEIMAYVTGARAAEQ